MAAHDNSPVTRSELKAELAGLEERLEAKLETKLETKLSALHDYIDERTRDMQTELLRAFADYNTSALVRFRKLEADTSNIDASTTLRLSELERQMTDFKIRLIALESQR